MVNILRGADVAFTNLETRIHTFKGYPMPSETMENNTYQQADPFIAEEMKWMGFDLIARANNHGLDYGYEMLAEESEILDKVGLVHAGVGRNLAEATMPAYLETEKGRVALVSLCTDFPPHCPAGEQRRDMHGRPGINPMRHNIHYTLDEDSFENLKQICKRLGLEKAVKENEIIFLKNRFEQGNSCTVTWTPIKSDLVRNTKAIKEATRAADYVLVSLHHHSSASGPALKVQQVARDFIDAGADVIIGHGPHVIQGVEIYNKKPILYSLGNFFYQSETIKRFPAEIYDSMGLGDDDTPQDVLDMRDALRSGKKVREGYEASRTGELYMRWFETLLAFCTFRQKELTELKIYPLISYHESRAQRGRPILAEEEPGKKIIDYVSECSKQWGTKIEFKEGVGYVEL
jgi:poly-gamma-glutamate capsule biosynthesis protein CapA/YwtB (metallophosphatase superfamily)